MFHVMRMAKEVLRAGGQLIEAQISVPSVAEPAMPVGLAPARTPTPLVACLAARHGRAIELLLINKDPSRGAEISISVRDGVIHQAAGERLAAPGMFAQADTSQASRIEPMQARLSPGRRQVISPMEPASVARLTLQLS